MTLILGGEVILATMSKANAKLHTAAVSALERLGLAADDLVSSEQCVKRWDTDFRDLAQVRLRPMM